nr:cell adhesion molecule Dscam2-like [Cherax quadricarinatus]
MPPNTPALAVVYVMPPNTPPLTVVYVMPPNTPALAVVYLMPPNTPALAVVYVMPPNTPPLTVVYMMPPNTPPLTVVYVTPPNTPPLTVVYVMPPNTPVLAVVYVMPPNTPAVAVVYVMPPISPALAVVYMMPPNTPPLTVVYVMPPNTPALAVVLYSFKYAAARAYSSRYTFWNICIHEVCSSFSETVYFRFVTSPRELLTVSKVGKEDRAMYQCVVSGHHYNVQAAAHLALGDSSPELHYKFQEQTLQPGPSVSLKCVATGNPPPQFLWSLDGFPLPESERFLVGQYVTVHDDVISHVNITHVRVEDGGEYTCRASNTVGGVSHSAKVNVYGMPFIRQMRRVSAVAGSGLRIKCPVGGYPIDKIIWEKDGRMLPTDIRQRVFDNGTLIISQTQRDTDGGRYTCRASNRQGHSASRDVTVTVTG